MSTPAVFFELGGTLGASWASLAGGPLSLFRPYRGLSSLLGRLGERARLGVLELDPSIRPADVEKAIAGTVLSRFLEPALVVMRGPGETDPFGRALAAAGLEDHPDLAIFVAPTPARRLAALARGLRVAPHPRLVEAVLDGDALYHVRLEARDDVSDRAWSRALQGLEVVPLVGAPGPVLYAVAADRALGHLADRVSVIERMGRPEEVAEGALYLFRTPPAGPSAELALVDFGNALESALPFVRPTDDGILVALPGNRRIDEFHPPGAGHGHTAALLPSVTLLQPAAQGGALVSRALTTVERTHLDGLDAAALQLEHDVWVGKDPVATPSGSVLIESRHAHHPGNALTVSALLARLEDICGAEHTCYHEIEFDDGTWWNVHAEIPGASDELVVIGAHLDSTAANTDGYPGNEATQAAPGADDDASGMAGVLAAAEVLKGLSAVSPPQRTIRFVLFNVEEQGVQGSPWYASDLKDNGPDVVAMIQMDMIGWLANAQPPRVFELHGAGTQDFSEALHAASAELAQVVVDAAAQVSPLLQAEVIPKPGEPHDPVAGRSDHSSFQAMGWPACLVAEDLFGASAASPGEFGNPDYHESTDLSIDYGYAADVARAVAAAAWMIARPTPGVIAIEGPPEEGGGRRGPIVVTPDTPDAPDAPGDGGGTESPTPISSPVESLPVGAEPTAGGEPMPTKYLVEFLAKWIRDEEFRCKVLHKEQTTLQEWELTTPQIMDLLSLDKKRIVKRLVDELEGLGIDLQQAQQEVYGVSSGGELDFDSLLSPGEVPGAATGSGTTTGSGVSLRAGTSGAGSGRFRVLQPGLREIRPEVSSPISVAVALLSGSTAYNEGQVHIRGIDPISTAVDVKKSFVIRGQGFDEGAEVEFRKQDEPGTTVAGEIAGISCDMDVYQRVTVSFKPPAAGYWLVHGRNPGEVWSTETVILTVT